jgi:hypothetical protein
MGGTGRPGRTTGGGYCAVGLLGVALVPTLALTACAHAPVGPKVVEVVKPVAVNPITPAQVPTPPAPLPPRPASLSQAADTLLGRWCEAVAYMLRADPLLRLSAGEKATGLPAYPECEKH